MPNTFRIAVVCDAFERVAPLTGRYEGVLVLIWRELIRAIFLDYTNDLPGSGAKAYAERMPFFLEARRLRELAEEQAKKIGRMNAQRERELEALKGRNEMITKTLTAWNRALGHSAGSSESEQLKTRIDSLEELLKEANSEAARLREEAYKDPVEKCIEIYQTCELEQREQVLMSHILHSEAMSTSMIGQSTVDICDIISHMLSRLPPDEFAKEHQATSGKVIQQLLSSLSLSPDDKAEVAKKMMKECTSAEKVRSAVASESRSAVASESRCL